VTLLDILRHGNLGIAEPLEGGDIPAVEAKAEGADVDSWAHDADKAGGIGIKGQERERRESPRALRHGVCRAGRWLNRSAAPPEP